LSIFAKSFEFLKLGAATAKLGRLGFIEE